MSQHMWTIFKIYQIVSVLLFLRLKHCVEKDVIEKSKDLTSEDESLEVDRITTRPLHHVGIITKSPERNSMLCGGSIISNNTIVTAAHCLERTHNATVILHKSSNATQSVKTTNFIIHPKWHSKLLRHDIALMKLPQPADLPDLYSIELSFDVKLTPKQQAVVYGWEKRHLQPVWTKYRAVIISNKDCAKYYGSLVTKYTVCTESTGHGSGCHGFSGGGLVVDGMLVGVVSFGADQCDMGYPTAYTKISRYKKWMEKNSDNY